jgi:hypothetical protein
MDLVRWKRKNYHLYPTHKIECGAPGAFTVPSALHSRELKDFKISHGQVTVKEEEEGLSEQHGE